MIFRKEALEQQDRLYGDVLIIQPLSLKLLVLGVIIVVSAISAFLSLGTFAKKQTVYGMLLPETGSVRVYSPRSAIVNTLLVSEGEMVRQGDALLILAGEQHTSAGVSVEESLLEQYQIQATLLRDKQGQIPSGITLEKRMLEEQKYAIQLDLDSISSQKSLMEQQLAILDNQIANQRRLAAMDVVAFNNVQALKTDQLALSGQIVQLANRAESLQSNSRQIDLQLEQLPLRSVEQFQNLELEHSRIQQRITELAGHQAQTIVAETTGIATTIQAKHGQQVTVGEHLVTIIPENTALEAKVLIPASAIGFVKKGQLVNIRYDAFPYQKFGIYQGTITEVSQHVLLPQELPANSEMSPIMAAYSIRGGAAANAAAPSYVVTVKLSDQNVTAFGNDLPLKPGIQLEADVVLSERTLIEWLLEPLFSLKGKV